MATRDLQRLEAITGRALERSLAAYEREIVAIYNTVLQQTQARMATIYERYSVAGELTNAEMTKYNRLTNLEKEINRIIGVGTQRSRAAIERLTKAQYEEAFFRHSWAIDQHIGVGLKWGVLRPEAIAAAVENPLRLIAEDRLRALGREKIRRAVAQAILRGDSFPNMAKNLRTAIVAKGHESLAYNAIRIARTEGGRAQTLGTLLSYDKAEEQGVEMDRVWVASIDDRTRDSHAGMDGVIADEDGMFESEVGPVAGPRLSGVAEFDINCRCTTVARVRDLPPPVLRRIKGEGVQPYQTYREWKTK